MVFTPTPLALSPCFDSNVVANNRARAYTRTPSFTTIHHTAATAFAKHKFIDRHCCYPIPLSHAHPLWCTSLHKTPLSSSRSAPLFSPTQKKSPHWAIDRTVWSADSCSSGRIRPRSVCGIPSRFLLSQQLHRPIFKIVADTLDHHCGFCERPLSHPGARASCFGTHAGT